MPREMLLIWMMPWAEFPDTLVFGKTEFWDFYREGPAKITDSQEMLWLAQFFSCFRDRNGAEITNFTAVQASPNPFDGLGKGGNEKVRWASNAIAFAYLIGAIKECLAGNLAIESIGNSERFQLMQFQIDEDGNLYYSDAGREGISSVAGKNLLFYEPHQNAHKVNAPDMPLLQALSKVNDTQADSPLWRKLGVCFEWFYTAWTLSSDFSQPARYVALMTAFESLVKENTERAPEMAQNAAKECEFTALPQTEEIVLGGKKPKSILATKPEKFIFDFAQYRNTFAHGGELPWGQLKYVNGLRSLDTRLVMSLVIYCIVARRLLSNGGWEEDFEKAEVVADLKNVIEGLQWHTNEKLSASPHIEYLENLKEIESFTGNAKSK